ncbi:MAG: class I SAM-dependent methyltransferase [Bacteroidota bacterium]
MNNIKRCTICNSQKLIFLLKPIRGKSIYICRKCSNAITIPHPKVSYADNDFFLGGKNDVELFRTYSKPIIKYIRTIIKHGRLLDIGTGGGFLLEEAQRCGFQAEGIEPSKSAVSYCRSKGLKVTRSLLKDNLFRTKYFNIISASHVLEHVEDPNDFLKICRELLANDGYMFLSQTNYTGSIPKLLGKYWEGWMPNEHYTHFSPRGIQYVLEKCGFKVLDVTIVPLGYKLRWKWGNVHTLANNIYNSVNFLISKFHIGYPFTGDQMYIAAKKGDI